MYKVLIADDEPKIRRGINEAVPWEELGLAVVGLARDGAEAMDIVASKSPDICLVDINMPVMNGLELIKRIKEKNPSAVTIIITGFDSFDYAQQALKLKAFDFLLKPINEEELKNAVMRAKAELVRADDLNKKLERAQELLLKNMPLLKDKFLSEWMDGALDREEILEQLAFHSITLQGGIGVSVVKPAGLTAEGLGIGWERRLLLFAVQNVVEENISGAGPSCSIIDSHDNIVSITQIDNRALWNELKPLIEKSVQEYLKYHVTFYQGEVLHPSGFEEVPFVYEGLLKAIETDSGYMPIVRNARNYVESHYMEPELSLQEIADRLEVSTGYLSRIFKQYTGVSFTDYLKKIRITESIKLMNNPSLKIYEVAEQVGYSSQHYFCYAFKKVLGISPSEYRQKEQI